MLWIEMILSKLFYKDSIVIWHAYSFAFSCSYVHLIWLSASARPGAKPGISMSAMKSRIHLHAPIKLSSSNERGAILFIVTTHGMWYESPFPQNAILSHFRWFLRRLCFAVQCSDMFSSDTI